MLWCTAQIPVQHGGPDSRTTRRPGSPSCWSIAAEDQSESLFRLCSGWDCTLAQEQPTLGCCGVQGLGNHPNSLEEYCITTLSQLKLLCQPSPNPFQRSGVVDPMSIPNKLPVCTSLSQTILPRPHEPRRWSHRQNFSLWHTRHSNVLFS